MKERTENWKTPVETEIMTPEKVLGQVESTPSVTDMPTPVEQEGRECNERQQKLT